MKKILFLSLIFVIPLAIIFQNSVKVKDPLKKYYPGDYFYSQRAYPYAEIPEGRYEAAIAWKNSMLANKATQFTKSWQQYGPTNIGGRITALDVDVDNGIIYAGAAAGGILRSTDQGVTWDIKTDSFPSLSIGAMKIDPVHSNIIYCGTGEANISTDSYAGFGMLKSTDNGESWQRIGLAATRHIAEIEVHPLNSNLIFVAGMGGLYSKSADRGLYKSTNGGNSWSKALYVSDSTSCVDVAIDPTDTNIVYAAMWERLRSPSFRKAAGISTALYKSTNCGLTWTKLTSGLPAYSNTSGRISIAVAKSNPNYVYVLFKKSSAANGNDNVFSSFYKSTDKGVTWVNKSSSLSGQGFSNFGWYFGSIDVDPTDPNKVYVGDIDYYRSVDGGTSFTNITNGYSGTFDQQHPDQHAIWINPTNTSEIIVGNDGGVFRSINSGTSWTKSYNLPLSQFYAATVDFLQPQRVYGGLQDNGSIRTLTGDKNTWEEIYGGDGFHAQVDYTNSNIIYCESQNGGLGRSTDLGQSFSYIASGLDLSRTNWSSPYCLDPVNPQILYFGSYKLHKTTNRGDNWTAISPDLTRGANGSLGTITCISAVMATDNINRVIYVGTNDAKLSVTKDGGSVWFEISGTLPNRYVTDVVADKRTGGATAYATLSGYNLDSPNAHIYKTTNFGGTWTPISSTMPDVPVNSLIIDYNYSNVLYVGTDAGVFYSANGGLNWQVLGNSLPNSPVFDIVYHQSTQKLYAATHGRSVFSYDLTGVVSVENSISKPDDLIFKPVYPNPITEGYVKFDFIINESGFTKLEIFDVSGKLVSTILEGEKTIGSFSYNFNTNQLSSGVYFCRLTVGKKSVVNKIVIMK